jgi:hypothetical protein
VNAIKLLSLMLWALVSVANLSVAAHFYVNAAAQPGGNGVSWETAFRYLQDALDQTVSGRGDKVWIAAGIYHPDEGANVIRGDRRASFYLKDGVSLYGGFEGGETSIDNRDWELNEVVLSGKIFQEQIYWSLSICTIEPYGEVTLDGIKVSGGNANGSGSGEVTAAAIYSTSDYFITVKNSKFSNHSSIAGGSIAWGGTWLVHNSTFNENYGIAIAAGDWTITDSTFSNNFYTVSLNGFRKVSNSTFQGNQGSVATGGIWEVVSSSFSGNVAANEYHGGVSRGGEWKVSDSIFYGNSSAWKGGVAHSGTWDVVNSVFESNSSVEGGVAHDAVWNVKNSTFENNSADFGGVANMGTWSTSNCIFAGNTANNGAVAYRGTWTVTNSSFVRNIATESGMVQFGRWIITNSIVDASNISSTGKVFVDMALLRDTLDTAPSPISIRGTNLIQGGLSVITMNSLAGPGTLDLGSSNLLDADPLFVAPMNLIGPDGIHGTADDGLRLQAGSPAIGMGNLYFLPLDIHDLDNDGITEEPVPFDRAGFRRIQDDTLDLGAYEFGDETSPLLSLTISSTVGGNSSRSGLRNFSFGESVEVTATAEPGFIFQGWTGTIVSSNSTINIIIDQNHSLTAIFEPDLADDDGDGLTNYEEIIVYGTDPNNADTSGDGINDGQALAAGLNPLINYSPVLELIRLNPGQFDLHSEDSIRDMRIGGFVLSVTEDGYIAIRFNILESDDLQNWSLLEQITRDIEMPNGKNFYRIQAQGRHER